MSVSKKKFGTTKNGEEVTLYTLKNSRGMTASFIDYGAILVKLFVPDANGKFEDVVLGYDNLAEYEDNPSGFGSFIGRNANRIGEAKFELNEKVYELEKNDGKNNLHGGSVSYNKFVYEAEIYEEEDSVSIRFSRRSPDMEQGFPGNLDLSVTYTLSDNNELRIKYMAISDQDTIVNLTNHSYFNLAGHKSGSVLNHLVQIEADKFTPTSDDLIPTGEFVDVTGTPMDFRKLKPVGQDINANYKPLIQASGYDHNYVLSIKGNEVSKVAELLEEKSGRKMNVYTNMPGLQLYTGNFLNNVKGKESTLYQDRSGICFETQYFPNTCNTKAFPSCVLKAGEKYDSVTIYKFE